MPLVRNAPLLILTIGLLQLVAACNNHTDSPRTVETTICALTISPAPGRYAGAVTVSFFDESGQSVQVPVIHESVEGFPRPTPGTAPVTDPPAAIPLESQTIELDDGFHRLYLQSPCDQTWVLASWDIDTHTPQVTVSPAPGQYTHPVTVELSPVTPGDLVLWRAWPQGATPPTFAVTTSAQFSLTETALWFIEAYGLSPAGVTSSLQRYDYQMLVDVATLTGWSIDGGSDTAISVLPQVSITFDRAMAPITVVEGALVVTRDASELSIAALALWPTTNQVVFWPPERLEVGDRVHINASAFFSQAGRPAVDIDQILPELEVATSAGPLQSIVVNAPWATTDPGMTAAIPIDGTPFTGSATLVGEVQTVTGTERFSASVTADAQRLYFPEGLPGIPAGTTARILGLIDHGSETFLLTPPISYLRMSTSASPSPITADIVPLPGCCAWALHASLPLAATAAARAEVEWWGSLPQISKTLRSYAAPGDGRSLILVAAPPPAATGAAIRIPAGDVVMTDGRTLNLPLRNVIAVTGTGASPAWSMASLSGGRFHPDAGGWLLHIDSPWQITAASIMITGLGHTLPLLDVLSLDAIYRKGPGGASNVVVLTPPSGALLPPDGTPIRIILHGANPYTGATTTITFDVLLDQNTATPSITSFGGHGSWLRTPAGIFLGGLRFDYLPAFASGQDVDCQPLPAQLACPPTIGWLDTSIAGPTIGDMLTATDVPQTTSFAGDSQVLIGVNQQTVAVRDGYVFPSTAVPLLISPPDGITAGVTAETFAWTAPPVNADASVIWFFDTTGDVALEYRVPPAVTATTIPLVDLLPGGSYTWRAGYVRNDNDPFSHSAGSLFPDRNLGYAVSATRTIHVP